MNDIQQVFVRFLALITFVGVCTGAAIAQGPPVFLDTCRVSSPMRFKSLPVPGEFVPGNYEVLRACPSLGNSIVTIAKVKAGKAKRLKVELRMENGKLFSMQAISKGEKNFEKLYDQVISQAGIPSKMVESEGVCSYSWDLRFKLKGHVEFHYDPALEKGTVVIMQ